MGVAAMQLPAQIENVCVYCGSASSADEKYKGIARKAGLLCAENGWTVIYGGGRGGLMGVLADSAMAKGGEVIGVIPRHLQTREVAHNEISELYITESMHECQMRMNELSDAFVILPGGLGTLAEFFEVVTWKQLGLHNKPIAVINTNGYWDTLVATVKNAQQERFLHRSDFDLFTILTSPDDLPAFLGT